MAKKEIIVNLSSSFNEKDWRCVLLYKKHVEELLGNEIISKLEKNEEERILRVS